MTAPLSIINGFLSGRQQREADDYDRSVKERDRTDRLAQQAQALLERQQAAKLAEQERTAQTERQNAMDIMGAADKGYVPTAQLQGEAKQATDYGAKLMAPGAATFDDTGMGAAISAAGQQAQATPSLFKLAGESFSKGRQSVAEQNREDQQRARREELDARTQAQIEAAKVAAQARLDQQARDQGFRREMQNDRQAGQAPQKTLQVPPNVVSEMAETRATLGVVDEALNAIGSGKADGHIGPSRRFLPNWVSQVTDPQGNAIRGQIAGIGATIRHQLSGAAISPSEAKYLEPDIPEASDPPQAAQEKLLRLRTKLSQIDADKRQQYSTENGYRNAVPTGPVAPQGAAGQRPPMAPAAPKSGRNIGDY